MYRIDPNGNKVVKLQRRTFSELHFKERENLQEWIAKEPELLGEGLLIIQKEFSGFSETNERLDLLALDKHGSLVIIENKLDDTGKDVTWQALKYASYCSSLTKENIRKIYQEYLDKEQPNTSAEEQITEFLEEEEFEGLSLNKGITQRIILIAAKFRKEVTSTVLWLLNYKLRVQCFVATPYSMGEELILNMDQIIPTKEAEDYMISMADKAQEDIVDQSNRSVLAKTHTEFWEYFLKYLENRSPVHRKMFKPSSFQYLDSKTNVEGVKYRIVARKKIARVILRIDGKTEAECNQIYDKLLDYKKEIDQAYGKSIKWNRHDGKLFCGILEGRVGNIYDKENWDSLVGFLADRIIRMEKAFRGPLKSIEGNVNKQ